MKKDILKNVAIILLCLTIIIMLVIKVRNKFVYVENENEHICQKCVIIDDNYYCQTYGGDK